MYSQEFKEHICRICLDESVVLNWNNNLFEYYDITYKDCYYKYSQLEYLDPDPFSPMLCQNCLNGLENVHTLISRATESYAYFEETKHFNLQIADSTNVDEDIKYSPTEFETVLIEELEIDVIDEQSQEQNLSNDFDNKSVSTGRSKRKKQITKSYIKIKDNIDEYQSVPVLKSNDTKDNLLLLLSASSSKSRKIQNAKCKSIKQNSGNNSINKKLKVSDENKCNTKDIKTSKLENEWLDDQICDVKIMPKTQTEGSNICLICSKVFPSKYAAQAHAKTHIRNRERKETCKVCGLKFFNKPSLYAHKRIHNENREKKHKCDFCNKAFYNKGALNIHRRIHLGQMTPCSLCTKEFFRQIDLDRHMVSHSAAEINSNTKKRSKYYVRCKHCDKSILSTSFKSHTAAHLNTPLMKCSICNKEFFSRGSCVLHMKNIHKKGNEEYNDFIILHTRNRISRLFLEQNEEIQFSNNFEWSKEAVLQLTEMWQKYEFLYNPKHTYYRNTEARNQAYNEMADKLKIFNTNIEGIDVKTKITYLRGQYTREVAKEKKRGARADQFYVPFAYWFNHLSFLDNFIKVRKERSNIFERMDSLKLNENLCVICLDNNVTLDWNEDVAELCNMSYKDCYYKYTNLQPSTSDSFPSNLCKICSNGLRNAHLLFEKALESFKFLQGALTNKEEFDMEINTSQDTMNFEIKILDVCESNDLIEEESITDDKTLIDIEDEIICPTNAYDNVVRIENAINDSISKEMSMHEAEIIEHVDITPIPNSQPLSEELLEQELSQSSDTKPTTSSTTVKGRKFKTYLCAYCSLKVNDKSTLRTHEATHSENRKRTETCPKCGIKLYTKMALRNHMEIHEENRQKKYKCEFCDKAFFNRGALNVHRRIHLGQMVPCRLCPKEFFRQVDLDRHLVRHSAAHLQKKGGQSKYTVQCQYCNKTVASTKWRAHKAVHIGEPQVKCKICDKDFFSRHKVVRHLKQVHQKVRDEYEEFIYYYANCVTRMSHLMIKQQEIVQPVTD
ncbi:zinc finger protein 423-like [Calliphora vicina]|uniref:zinc finger protein 423-like n=1 Tax=Calliphora vicina TaxID=7373 RepID=UPI00325B65D3